MAEYTYRRRYARNPTLIKVDGYATDATEAQAFYTAVGRIDAFFASPCADGVTKVVEAIEAIPPAVLLRGTAAPLHVGGTKMMTLAEYVAYREANTTLPKATLDPLLEPLKAALGQQQEATRAWLSVAKDTTFKHDICR